ncbi:MAG TPA: hypothetical protein VF549_08135 [Solirubrobacteraceae bacterium]
MLVTLITALLAAPASAADGTFTQILCANPDTGQGLGVPSIDGLSAPATAAAWRATITPSTCSASGASAITLGPTSAATVPDGGYAALQYEVADPALTIESADYYRAFASGDHPFEISTRVAQHAGASAPDAATATNGFDTFWSGQGQAAGRSDQPFAAENHVAAERDARSFSVSAQCRDTGATCSHGVGEWSYRFFGGEVRLHDAEPPVIDEVGGSVADASSLSTGELTFRAHDAGSGLYRFRLDVDDEELELRDLTDGLNLSGNDRVGTCFDLNPQNADPYEFAHQQPCPASLERALTIDTMTLDDGPHHLRAVLEDAGGNETVLVDREITVDNHPAPEVAGDVPDIRGRAAVGEPLTGTNGTWRNAIKYDYYWQRCPTDTSCSTLVDHPGRTYVATEADVGAQMRFVVVATNAVGEWTMSMSPYSAPVTRGIPSAGTNGGATSPATPAVAAAPSGPAEDAPAGSLVAPPPPPRQSNGRGATHDARLVATLPGGARKRNVPFTARTLIAGRLTDKNGHAIEGALLQLTTRASSAGANAVPLGTIVTGADGGFAYTVPPGPSRRIEVAYRASLGDTSPAVTAAVRVAVRARVSLRVRAARPGRVTWMTGRLRYLPRPGVQIQIQALDGRRWRTFDTTTTRRGGRFRFGYRFKVTATGRAFQLRVVVASPIYPFARGASRRVRVQVPR